MDRSAPLAISATARNLKLSVDSLLSLINLYEFVALPKLVGMSDRLGVAHVAGQDDASILSLSPLPLSQLSVVIGKGRPISLLICFRRIGIVIQLAMMLNALFCARWWYGSYQGTTDSELLGLRRLVLNRPLAAHEIAANDVREAL